MIIMLLVLETIKMKKVCKRYWSFLIDDDCIAIISGMFDILFFSQGVGGWQIFEKEGWVEKRGNNL